jgi:hypothetical protein
MTLETLVPESFGGNDIQSSTYKARFVVPRGGLDAIASYLSTAVESTVAGGFPRHIRGQPSSRIIPLEVEVVTETQANVEQLKKWFDPANGPQYLVASAADASSRRILCFPEIMAPTDSPPKNWSIRLRAATGVWEANSATTDNEEVTATAQTWALTNAGNTRAYPTFTLTPNTQMANTASYIHRRRLTVANRSDVELGDPVGDGYPIDLGENAFDTDALNTASKMQADLDDLRVVLDGEEIYNWPDPAGADNATSKVWSNLRYRARKTVTMPAFASNVSPAAGATITVTNPEGFAGWPTDFFLVYENECVQLTKLSAFEAEVVKRGARGTTAAAHSATTAYWVEHPFLDIIHDYTAATAPNPPDDRKPRIDLALSLNTEHHWTAAFFNDNDRRSRAWQREFTDDGPVAGYVRSYETGGAMVFEDSLAVAGKPRYNNAILSCPVPIDDAANAVELDMTVNDNLLLHGYLVDRDGHESRLIKQGPTAALTDQQFTPSQLSYLIRFNARIGCLLGAVATGSDGVISEVFAANGARFVLAEEKEISGWVMSLKQNGSLNADIASQLMADSADAPSSSTGYTANQTTAFGTITTNYTNIRVTLASPIRLPAGTYWIRLVKGNATGVLNWQFQAARLKANQYFRQGGSTQPQNAPNFRILTTTSEAQTDAALETGDDLTIDNIELNYDSAYTPKIVMATEEDMYLHNLTLTNTTTGKAVSVFMPCRVGAASLVIDTENATITDSETGWQIPFALRAGNLRDLYLQPGSNTWRYDEVGVVNVDVDSSWRDRWL